LNNQLAIPVGTGTTYSYDKFMWDKRDLNCNQCKNGMKSMVTKRINDKVYNIPVVCTCVPYAQSEDADGVQVVVYKGRRERWVKGKRPEIYISDEQVRGKANEAALNTRDMVTGDNVINNKKYQFTRVNSQSGQPIRAEFLSKGLPGMPITRPGDVLTEYSTRSSLPDNPTFGDVTKKNLKKGVKPPQKFLHTLPNGTRVLVDDKTFSKLTGTLEVKVPQTPAQTSAPMSPQTTETKVKGTRGRPKKTVEVAAPSVSVKVVPAPAPVVAQAPAAPAKKQRGRPKKVKANA
jgi:hypothetical protein